MAIKIVTDSTADLPPWLAEAWGITVVPLEVRFGSEVYRDGVDLDADGFYHKLTTSPSFPATSQPSPGAFAEVYRRLIQEGQEVLSLHISAKLSGTYAAALAGRAALNSPGRIEVVDSLQCSMGLGLLGLLAARMADSPMAQILEQLRRAIPRTYLLGVVDSLEYLRRGGRIGKVEAFLGTLLKVKPIIACVDGEAHPLERVRTRERALERLVERVRDLGPLEEMAVLHSTDAAEAERFLERLAPTLPLEKLHRARFGPVLGTYLGPGAFGVALRTSALLPAQDSPLRQAQGIPKGLRQAA